MKAVIGKKGKSVVVDVEKGWVKRFCTSVGETNPLYLNEKVAKKSKYGGLIAPPGLLMGLYLVPELPRAPEPPVRLPRGVDGGGTWTFIRPIMVGDTLTGTGKIKDIYQRDGRAGPMLFSETEVTWRNQKRQVVARMVGRTIRY
ncbi:MAG: MaoC family dehydratase N-terminal domain-containing protein [Chloroflexi bacterium]|nr:MaoC family dehydratase N-terminal domain-containing protein [Chloroflexota bacterium]